MSARPAAITHHLSIARDAAVARNPAWAQMLGLCPLLAVSNSVVNALGLAFASAFVMLGAALTISVIRSLIAPVVRLPCFVLVIATFTTSAVMLLEAFAFGLYAKIALFVQIIVTNCMILGRVEAFASRQPPVAALMDALGTAAGFAAALLVLGAVREVLGAGELFAGMELLFGDGARDWRISILPEHLRLIVVLLPPGAFIVAGIVLGCGRALAARRTSADLPPAGR
jgi:electron transport complex protein RnfE